MSEDHSLTLLRKDKRTKLVELCEELKNQRGLGETFDIQNMAFGSPK